MAIWRDVAEWIGPTKNCTAGGMHADVRGDVVHVASGSYAGTIAWQRDPKAKVSSHFIVKRDGRVAQMVDTADASWAQRNGNSAWLSIECEGRTPGDVGYEPGLEVLTPQQIEAVARILVKTHQVYGTPLQLATSPSGRGLGHHSMGAECGVDWGHSHCPGDPIKNQKPAILARALQLAGGVTPTTGGAMADFSLTADQTYVDIMFRVLMLVNGGPQAGGQGKGAPNALHNKLDQLIAAAAADETRDNATLTAIRALTVATGGDPQPILDAIAGVRTETHGIVTQLQQAVSTLTGQNAALQHELDEVKLELDRVKAAAEVGLSAAEQAALPHDTPGSNR